MTSAFKRVPVEATAERLREVAVRIAALGSRSGDTRWEAAQLMRQAADEIEALKAAASPEPAEEVSAWQPIETWEPKDVQGFYPYLEALVVVDGGVMAADWNPGENPPSTGEWWPANLDSEYGEQIFPTHWQPLPTPPPLSKKQG